MVNHSTKLIIICIFVAMKPLEESWKNIGSMISEENIYKNHKNKKKSFNSFFDKEQMLRIVHEALSFVSGSVYHDSLSEYTESQLMFWYEDMRCVLTTGDFAPFKIYLSKLNTCTKMIKSGGEAGVKSKSMPVIALYILVKTGKFGEFEKNMLLKDLKDDKIYPDNPITCAYFSEKLRTHLSLDDLTPLLVEEVAQKHSFFTLKKMGVVGVICSLMIAIGVLFYTDFTPKVYEEINDSRIKFKVKEMTNHGIFPTDVSIQYDFSSEENYGEAFIDWNDGQTPPLKLINKYGVVNHTFTNSCGDRKIRLLIGNRQKMLYVPVYGKGWLAKLHYKIQDSLKVIDWGWPFNTNGFIIYPHYVRLDNEKTIPFDFPFQNKGIIHVNPQKYITDGLIKNPDDFDFLFQKIQDFGIDADNMIIEARVKDPQNEGGLACFDTGIALHGDNDGSIGGLTFNLLQVGCTKYARILVGETEVGYNTKNPNYPLSTVGLDLDNWVTVKLFIKNNILQIFADNKLLVSLPYKGYVGELKFIQVAFRGSGSMDWINITNLQGQTIYHDDL